MELNNKVKNKYYVSKLLLELLRRMKILENTSGTPTPVTLQQVLDTGSLWEQDSNYYELAPDSLDIFFDNDNGNTGALNINQGSAYIEKEYLSNTLGNEAFSSIFMNNQEMIIFNYDREIANPGNYAFFNQLVINNNGFNFSTQSGGSSASITTNNLTATRSLQFPDASGVLALEKPYKVYVALLTQTGTSAPVATVLENNLGNVIWTRDNVGIYKATLTGEFIANKTGVSIGSNFNNNTLDIGIMQTSNLNTNDFTLTTFDHLTQAFDEVLLNTLITIKVYN